MTVLELVTEIRAPIERVFDLSRSVDLHMRSTARTGERAIAGVTTGLMELDQEVTWRAKHFGVWQELTSRITRYDRPRHFRDSMVRGAFRRFDHDHFFSFSEASGTTTMKDRFDFAAPLGVFGRAAERLFLARYLEGFLRERNETIRREAEAEAVAAATEAAAAAAAAAEAR